MQIDLKTFNEAITSAFKVVSPNPIIPALKSILCEFSAEGIRLIGTCVDITIIIRVDGEFEDTSFLLSPNMRDYLKMLPDQPIEIKAGESIEVIHSAGTAKFPFESTDGFIKIPEYEIEDGVDVDLMAIADAVHLGSPFAMTEKEGEFFPQFTCINFVNKKAYASDKLSFCAINTGIEGKFSLRANRLNGVIPTTGDAKIIDTEKNIIIAGENFTLFVTKITANFPQGTIDKFLGLEKESSITVEKDGLLASVKRLSASRNSQLTNGIVALSATMGYISVGSTDELFYEEINCDGELNRTMVDEKNLIKGLKPFEGDITISTIGPHLLIEGDDIITHVAGVV